MELALNILEIAAYVIGVAALLIIIYVLLRKIRMVASIDTQSIPKHQQEKKRKDIASDRLMRKFTTAGGWMGRFVKPFFVTVGGYIGGVIRKLMRFERKIALEKAETTKKESPEAADKKKSLLLERAQEAVDAEEYKQAEELYIEMISIDPGCIEAYKKLGDLYMETKEFKTASETFSYIIQLEEKKLGKRIRNADEVPAGSELADHYADLTESNIGLEDWKQALANIQESLRLEPNNPKYLDLQLTIHINLKQKAQAQEALEHLKNVNPENQKINELEKQIAEIE